MTSSVESGHFRFPEPGVVRKYQAAGAAWSTLGRIELAAVRDVASHRCKRAPSEADPTYRPPGSAFAFCLSDARLCREKYYCSI